MAFDKPTRNKLARMVGECRRLLTDDIRGQRQSTFGIQPDGNALAVEKLTKLDDRGRETAIALRHWLGHLAAAEAGSDAERREKAADRMANETAFTYLNRLAALRMCEERGHVIECVRRGLDSDGFAMYENVAGQALGDRGTTYEIFLDCMFDELAIDLGVLFHRHSPHSLVFPSPPCIEAVLKELNAADLTALWKEDETIGWVYQFFNEEKERRQMRDESAAPRNSRELAVRNQFFTPRYVVEFLTDNTLGRTWYEMRHGKTCLTDRMAYFIRHQNEVFLPQGVTPQAPSAGQEQLSKEELLQAEVQIAYRAKKDPRDLKVLDPACGSGHFLLYAFDLLETIYEEAWRDESLPSPAGRGTGGEVDSLPSPVLGRGAGGEGLLPLRVAYPTLDRLRVAVPELILRHNLYGIDIDRRACQIAALALWLRAQRRFKDLGLKPAARPRITKSNIVTAEPMPREDELLEEAARSFRQPILGQLLRTVFEKMKLAGEAGSLLKIEEEIRGPLAEGRRQWEAESQAARDRKGRKLLFTVDEMESSVKEQQPTLDLSGITDEEFWTEAEPTILAELKRIAAASTNGKAVERTLFAEDAEQGFAFVDLCRQRYDVVLMNPPFGDASLPSKPYIEDTYGDTKGDVYKAFVECFQTRLVPAGYLGIISSRTGFFLGQSEDWRTRVVLRLFRPIALADLGSGVLDAMVEVAAYVLRNLSVAEARDLTLSLVPVLKKVERDKQDRFSLPKWQAARDGLKRHQAATELEFLEAAGFIQRCPGDIIRYKPHWRAAKAVIAPPEPVFSPLVCIRVIAEEDKGVALRNAIKERPHSSVFVSDPASFRVIPGTPFAYWVVPHIRETFKAMPAFESEYRMVRVGDHPGDGFRYIRLAWEVPRGVTTHDWRPYQKGGIYSPFYCDQHLVVDWDENRKTYRGFLGRPGRPNERPSNYEFFFRAGLTWPRRTSSRFAARPLPAGCVFADKGPVAFVRNANPEANLTVLAILNSTPFRILVGLQLAATDAAARSYEVGIIQRTPFPIITGDILPSLVGFAEEAWRVRRGLDETVSNSHAFVMPALLTSLGVTLSERAAAWGNRVLLTEHTIAAIQEKIDAIAFCLYGLDTADIAALTTTLVTQSAHVFTTDAAPGEADDEDEPESASADTPALVADLLAYALGAAFGRWDVRLATGACPAPPDPDPFDPLPACAPGMLVGPDGLPAEPGRIVSEEWLRARPSASAIPAEVSVAKPTIDDDTYPLRISWDGILADDAGLNDAQPHQDDIVRRAGEVLELLWKDRSHEIQQEACEILGVSNLREWFRRPGSFFQDHLKRYSKSRRKAPIYWPLSTSSGSYTIWLYYPRLSDQTLYTVVNRYLEPKIDDVRRGVTRVQEEFAAASGGKATELREKLIGLQKLLGELEDLRRDLAEVAALPYKPNLNDGVIINAAPLRRLFRHRPWAKECEACWKKLEAGEYDWSHMAYNLWPERVREKCRKGRSLAIAHGLEDLFEAPPAVEKKRRTRKKGRGRS